MRLNCSLVHSCHSCCYVKPVSSYQALIWIIPEHRNASRDLKRLRQLRISIEAVPAFDSHFSECRCFCRGLVRVTKSGSRSITLEWRPHPEGPSPDSYLLRVEPGALEETVDHDTFDALSVQSHTINGLRPDVEYFTSLRALGALGIGGESSKVTLSHRTGRGMHCGKGAAEEVQPAGPSPSGASYFPGLGDVEGCRSRCEGNRQCVTFQLNAGNACWLYLRKPERQISGPRSDPGWWCAVRKE